MDIPKELRELPKWSQWVIKDGKKMPSDKTGKPYWKWGDSSKWFPYKTFEGFDKKGFDLRGTDYIVIDLDNCFNEDGTLKTVARKAVKYFNSYTEYSPSKKGLHIIIKAHYTKGNIGAIITEIEDEKNELVEIISQWITMTGDIYEGYDTIRGKDKKFQVYYNKYFPERAQKPPTREFDPSDPKEEIRRILDFEQVFRAKFPTKPKSGMYVCPWHHEKDGSFKAYNTHGYCYGAACRKSYDVFDVVMLADKCNFPYAVKILAAEAGVEVPELRSTVVEVNIPSDTPDDDEEEKVELTLEDEGIIYIEKDKEKLSAFNLQEWIRGKYHVLSMNGGSMFHYNGKCYETMSEHKAFHIASSILGDYKNLFSTYQCNQFKRHLLNESYVDELQDKNFLSLDNCLFNLESGEILDHTHSIFTLNALPYSYEPNNECPLWLQYMDSTFSGNVSLIEYAQEIMGYSLYKGLPAPVLFFFIGGPGTGKSTFLDTVTMLVGQKNMSALSLTDFKRTFSRSQLYGKLVNVCGETVTNSLLETVELKSATSGDWLSAQFKYQDEFQFKPYAKNYIAMNEFPNFIDDTFALWDRIYFLKFDKRFRGTTEEIIELSKRFEVEMSGIFNWALMGLDRLRENGWRFTIPAGIETFKEQMIRGQDPVYGFVMECLKEDAGATVLFSDVYSGYERYTEENHGRTQIISKRKFSKRISEDCGVVTERRHSNQLFVVNMRWTRDAREYV